MLPGSEDSDKGSVAEVRLRTREKLRLRLRQHVVMMATQGLELRFTDGAIEGVAATAAEVDPCGEDMGARRLHTLLERLLEEVSFASPGDVGECSVLIGMDHVEARQRDLVADQDLSRSIL